MSPDDAERAEQAVQSEWEGQSSQSLANHDVVAWY